MQTSSNSLPPIFVVLIVIVLGCVLLGLIYWAVVYNGLISKRNSAKRAFSGIDVQLKKRWDLIPQLVEVVKGYAAHEKEVFTKVIEARRMAMESYDGSLSRARMSSEQVIAKETPRIMALAEDYPEIKADEQFLWLQRNLVEVESQVSASSRAYNASVLKYNNGTQQFPSSLIAGKHGFAEMEFFTIKLKERKNVSI
jgi:LemA protein